MISGDVRTAAGAEGEFFEMLKLFHRFWSRIDVVCPRAEGAAPRTLFEKVHIHPAGRFIYPDLRAKLSQPIYTARIARRLLGERSYGLMVSHEVPPFHTTWAAIRLARRFRVPVVSEIHHVEGYPIAPDTASRLRRTATAWWVKYLNKRVAAIRTVNAIEVPGFLTKRGVDQAKILVLYSFDLDLNVFRPGPDGAAGGREIDFLFVGRLVANKGIEIFIKALALARRRHPGLRAVVIGSGPQEDAARALAEKEGLAGALEIIRWVKNREELTAYYRRAKALVVCSFAEGGPNVALEAMACGTPVIAPPIGVLREVLQDGVNGFVASRSPARIAEIMERFLDDPGLADHLGVQAPATVSRFESGAIIRAYALGLQKAAQAA